MDPAEVKVIKKDPTQKAVVRVVKKLQLPKENLDDKLNTLKQQVKDAKSDIKSLHEHVANTRRDIGTLKDQYWGIKDNAAGCRMKVKGSRKFLQEHLDLTDLD